MVHFSSLPKGALPTDDLVNFRLSQLDSALVQGELFGPSSVRTIRSGEVVINGGYQIIAAESGTTDTLDTITHTVSTVIPSIIVLRADTDDTITVTHNVGNIKTRTGVPVSLDGTETLILFWDGTQYNYIGGGRTGDVSVRAYGFSVSQNILNDTETLVTKFTDPDFYDINDMHDPATNPGRITFTTAGKYDIDAHIKWAANDTGYREVSLRLNGATTIARVREAPAVPLAGGVVTHQQVTTIYNMAVDDYVEVYVRHNKGSSLSIAGSSEDAALVFLAKLLAS